jgi:alkylhydroperoxidase family enzyme
VAEAMYAEIGGYRTSQEYSAAERLAIEYAELFATDHLAIDDAFFSRLAEHFSDAEILAMTVVAARCLGFGRLTHVLQVDLACPIVPEGASLAG